MRLGLGAVVFACLSVLACGDGSDADPSLFPGPGASSGGDPEVHRCPGGGAPAADPPASTAIDGDGPIVGDGEVRGAGPVSQGGGCAGGGFGADAAAAPPMADDSAGSGSSSSSSGSSESSSGSSGSSGGSSSSSGGVNTQPGVLTAGAWDDNRNFTRFLEYRDEITQAKSAGLLPITLQEHQAANAGLAAPSAKQKLDVSLVIDTTGSMGDELGYLQAEFDALASTIEAKFPGAEQRWSLVLYKDVTDSYVVRWYDFRGDTAEFRAKLAGQSAGGGGDFPEAADRAVDVGTRLSWRADPSVAKLMFWVGDAPHHAGTEQHLAGAIRAAQKSGIHVYPVASSGVDDLTELTMRTSAQLTGGRYIFLTDDSGVGNAHKEPNIACYFVTKLDKAILRMVDIEMSGVYHEPPAADVLRTGGDPKSGVCQLDDGGQVAIY